MARPIKQGLDYFSLDVDFFQDIKVRKIQRACGASSTSILIALLCNIYRDKGYYILWDDDLPFLIADIVGVSEGAVTEVIKKAVQVGFFDQEQFETNNIITSNGIQARFVGSVERRKEVVFNNNYLIVELKEMINVNINSIIEDSNRIVVSKILQNASKGTQSKVKESKGKKSKEENGEKKDQNTDGRKKLPTLSIAERKKSFKQEIWAKIGNNPKYNTEHEMLKNFFEYWTEHNENGRKMRFEREKIFDITRRLSTWKKKESEFKRPNNVQQTNFCNHDNSKEYEVF